MTIVCATDLHGSWGPVYGALDKMREGDWLLLLGDLELGRPLTHMCKPFTNKGIKVRWVAGNHDFEPHPILDTYSFLRGDPEAASWELHTRVEVMDGLRVAGLSGIYGDRDPNPKLSERWRLRGVGGRLPWELEQAIFTEDIHALAKLDPVDVVISHECPSDHFELRVLAMALQAKLWVHGHHHKDNVSFLDFCQVRCLEAERPWTLKIPDAETGL